MSSLDPRPVPPILTASLLAALNLTLSACDNAACPAGAIEQDGKCVKARADEDPVEVDVDVDPCALADAGSPCDENATCSVENRAARCVCNPGFDGDGQTCTPNPCHALDGKEVCGANASCAAAADDATQAECTCSEGFVDCDGERTNGCETLLFDDAKNCGACGFACAPGIACVEGACQPKYKQISFGKWFFDYPGICALTQAGEVWCSGDAAHPYDRSGGPVKMPGVASARAVEAGTGYGCAIHAGSDELTCWGSNPSGILGKVGNSITLHQQAVPGIAEVESGSMFNCAIVDGQVQCWGPPAVVADGHTYEQNEGRGIDLSRPVLERGRPLTGVVQLGANFLDACALFQTGGVSCWGIDASFPTQVSVRGVNNERKLLDDAQTLCGAGYYHCVLRKDATVACWGRDPAWAVNFPNEAPPKLEARTVPNQGIVELACGDAHACFRNDLGEVYCWGSAGLGALGLGPDITSRPFPSLVPGLSDVVRLYAGSRTCAVLRDGRTLCWGSDGTRNRFSPEEITNWL